MFDSLAQKIASFLSTAARAETALQSADVQGSGDDQLHVDGVGHSHSMQDGDDSDQLEVDGGSRQRELSNLESMKNEEFGVSAAYHIKLNPVANMAVSSLKEVAHDVPRQTQGTSKYASLLDAKALDFMKNTTEFYVVKIPRWKFENDTNFLNDGSRYVFFEKEAKVVDAEDDASSVNFLEVEAVSNKHPKPERSSHKSIEMTPSESFDLKRLIVQSVEVVTSSSQHVGRIDDQVKAVDDAAHELVNQPKVSDLTPAVGLTTPNGIDDFTADKTVAGTEESSTYINLYVETSTLSLADTPDDSLPSSQPLLDLQEGINSEQTTIAEEKFPDPPRRASKLNSLNAPKFLQHKLREQLPIQTSHTPHIPPTAQREVPEDSSSTFEQIIVTQNKISDWLRDSAEFYFQPHEVETLSLEQFHDHNEPDSLPEAIDTFDDSLAGTDDEADFFSEDRETISELLRIHGTGRHDVPPVGRGVNEAPRDRGRSTASVLLLLLASLTQAMHGNFSTSGPPSMMPSSEHLTRFSEILTHSFLNTSTAAISSFQTQPAVAPRSQLPVFDAVSHISRPKSISGQSFDDFKAIQGMNMDFPGEKISGTPADPNKSDEAISTSFQSSLTRAEPENLVNTQQPKKNLSATIPSLQLLPGTNFPASVTLLPNLKTALTVNTSGATFLPFTSGHLKDQQVALPDQISFLIDTPRPPISADSDAAIFTEEKSIENTTRISTLLPNPLLPSAILDRVRPNAGFEFGGTPAFDLVQILPNRDNSFHSTTSSTRSPQLDDPQFLGEMEKESTVHTGTQATSAITSNFNKLTTLDKENSKFIANIPRSGSKFIIPEFHGTSMFLSMLRPKNQTSSSVSPETKHALGVPISPEGTVICRPVESPACAPQGADFCLTDPSYPRREVLQALSSNARLASYFANASSTGPRGSFSLVAGLSRQRELSFGYSYHNPGLYDVTHWLGTEGYVCPSVVSYNLPLRAKNAQGRWRVIVQNVANVVQRIRTERCLHPEHPCRLVAPRYGSRCVQKFSLTQLLVMDPCDVTNRLFVDTFSLPSACSCVAQAYG
ncbi:uncharacterized protein LOC125178657 [Hyalella azteca]|uniref:Uncharacterized protein LOC125178657 n=1 Tax=Hyalella azteca TaxID=294128 RepID=A0A979FP87_HYAAZ|nr:uncharacterized protein LOC125178657 [Hyalella azteca]